MPVNYSDLYIKNENDPLYDDNALETKTRLQLLISKLYMILLTNKGTVLGDQNFGADIPKYLWKTKFPSSTIQNDIVAQIARYIPELNQNDYKVKVYILPGSHQDIGIIEVNINGATINVLYK